MNTTPNQWSLPNPKDLASISEIPTIFESLPEGKTFLNFLTLITRHHPLIKVEDTKETRGSLKITIPPLKNLDEFKSLYENSFLKSNNMKKNKSNYKKKNEKWKHEEIVLLVWSVSEYSYIHNLRVESFTDHDWKFVASLFPEGNPIKCKYKWQTIQKSSSQKGEWTSEEDITLHKLVNKLEKNFQKRRVFKWAKIANQLNSLKKKTTSLRLGKHCRERWLNHLDPTISKKAWTYEEDMFLLENIKQLGKKWADISKKMPGRNENYVKNRFTSLFRSVKNTKENGKKINPNNIEAVVEAIKKTLSEATYTEKKIKNENLDEKPINLVIYPSQKDPIDENKEISVESGYEKITFFESLRRKSNDLASKVKFEYIKKNPHADNISSMVSPLQLTNNTRRKSSDLSSSKYPTHMSNSSQWETNNFMSPKLKPRYEIFTQNFPDSQSSKIKLEEYGTHFNREENENLDENIQLFHKPKLAIFTKNTILQNQPNFESKSLRSDDPFSNFDTLVNTLKADNPNPTFKKEVNSFKRSEILVNRASDSHEDYLLQMHIASSPWLMENNKEITPSVKSNSPPLKKEGESPIITENKTYIYDLSNFILPNIYKKYQNEEEESISTPLDPEKQLEREKQLKMLMQDNLDDISQKLSSLSISDQLIIEANKILSISGMSPLAFSERFSEKIETSFFHNSNSHSGSHHTEKSIIIINTSSREDDEKKSHHSQKSKFYIRKMNEIDSSSLLDHNQDHVIFTRNGQRCKTHLIQKKNTNCQIKNDDSSNNSETLDKGCEEKKELSDQGAKMSVFNVPPRKGKKSTTVILMTKEKDSSFL